MKRLGSILFVTGCIVVASVGASAQEAYPSRPVRVIVPYAPGGATDIIARIIGAEFSKTTGQNFVVVNKPGGRGLVAIDQMVNSKPDGYTVMIGNVATNAITPAAYSDKMTFDYDRRVVAVSRLVDVPVFLVATTKKDFPVKSIDELIEYVKKNPGGVRYGTSGVGSYPHYNMAYFAKRAGGLDMIALPNTNGASGVIQDMLRGDAQVAFLNVATTAGLVRSGQLRALAVGASTRMPEFPNVPTLEEAGFAGTGTTAWQAMFAPAGTPKPILTALFNAVVKSMEAPAAKSSLTRQDFELVPNKSPADAEVWLADELKRWRTITKTVNLEISP